MLRDSETETEILLGNKQLLGIFFVVAVLLGVAFTGGYLVGHGSTGKKAATTETASLPNGETAPATTAAGGQTHTLGGEQTLPAAAAGGADSEAAAPKAQPDAAEESPKESVLGSRRRAAAAAAAKDRLEDSEAPGSRMRESASGYAPHAGSQYLQVTAVAREEAVAVADVLSKKGFQAHAVPKPGNAKLYRVIIGPVKDAGDLSSTRDALRKTGFREVIVQRY